MTTHAKNFHTNSGTPSFHKENRPVASVLTARYAIIFIASLGLPTHSNAQISAPESILKPVIISAPAQRQQLSVGGFDVRLSEQPISAVIITADDIRANGAKRLSELYKLDASVSHAYNAVGYIDYATVRGFVIDNKFNYRRDGLPISGDTAIGLANKESVEILKGTSGIQAGTSAPGGLVNHVIKRPSFKPVRRLDINLDANAQLGAALDLSGRFGATNAQGYRLNIATDHLNASAPATRGKRQLLALALDTRIGKEGLLEAEFEWSHQRQSNVPGLSLLGSAGQLPPADAKLNLNRQAWSTPSEFAGLTGSLRYTQAINDLWQWSAHLGSQRLKTDDRIAFPFGFECYAPNYTHCDRFESSGKADLYDFRSEGERRKKAAAQFKLEGSMQTGSVRHALSMGALNSSAQIQTPDQIFNHAGTIALNDPTLAIPAMPTPTAGTANTLRETTAELSASDVIAWNDSFKTWLGLRHTSLSRSNLLNATQYSQSFTTPWLAASYQFNSILLYASQGQGIESEIASAVNTTNPGQVLPASRSRQTELGIKHSADGTDWQASLFKITRPMSSTDACSLAAISPCNVQADGAARHTGIELSAQKRLGAWQLSSAGSWLRAQREGSAVAQINGLRPTNVPSHILRLNAAYRLSSEWQLAAHLSHEGRRAVLPDNSIFLPAWSRLDASLKWSTHRSSYKSSWQLSISNLSNKRHFQESPHQFGHAYLFPAAPRTLRLGASFEL